VSINNLSLINGDEYDWYKFNLDKTYKVTLDIISDHELLWDLWKQDPNLEEITYTDEMELDKINGENEFYYIRVKIKDTDVAQYALNLQIIEFVKTTKFQQQISIDVADEDLDFTTIDTDGLIDSIKETISNSTEVDEENIDVITITVINIFTGEVETVLFQRGRILRNNLKEIGKGKRLKTEVEINIETDGGEGIEQYKRNQKSLS